FRTDPPAARRLPAQALRGRASLEGRHARRGAAGFAQGCLAPSNQTQSGTDHDFHENKRGPSLFFDFPFFEVWMNLYAKLLERKDRPLRIGVIGAGKFGAMYIAQVPRTPGVHLVGIADLSPDNARQNLERVGWPKEAYEASSLDAAIREKRTYLSEDWPALVAHPEIDIIIESTRNPPAAVEHALAAFRNGKHVVMVTVEADAFCGPLLARKAAEAGVVYSLAYGDQPALICDLVDWARTAGFPVVAAGRGHKWLPHFSQSTPDTVWGYYGLTPEQAQAGGRDPQTV